VRPRYAPSMRAPPPLLTASLTTLLLAGAALAAGEASEAWRGELQTAMAAHWPGVAECTLAPLELFTVHLGGDGAISAIAYEGFDASERRACLDEVLVGKPLPPPGDGLTHEVRIRVEDPDLDMGFSVEEVTLRCDEQVVDIAAHEAVFETVAKDLKRCQMRRVIADRTMRGEVLVRYTVLPHGVVDGAEVVQSELDNERAHACMTEIIQRLRFPEPGGGCTVTLDQGLDFGLPSLLAREADVEDRVGQLKPDTITFCGGKPDDEGAPTVVVKLHIVGGEVEAATQLEAWFVDEAQAACLTNAARGWTFPGIGEARTVVHFRMEDPELPGL
jgi:hypothetical protein